MIYLTETFINDAGVTITRKTLLEDRSLSQSPQPPTYEANGILPITRGGQQGQINFRFAIPATGIEEAFANIEGAYEAAAVKAVEDIRMQDEAARIQQAQKIIIPPAGMRAERVN